MTNDITFKQKWINFLKAIGAPIPLFSIFGAVILIIVSIVYKDKTEFSILTTLIGSIFIGIAGAFIKGGYDELSGESILIKKGQSAIRNLSSISQQITQIQNWITAFIKRSEISKRELEEINRHLGTTALNISSGLADWIDIVPELRQTGEVVKNYENLIKAYIDELLKNKKELIAAGENKELKEQLEKKIKELEGNVKSLRAQSNVFSSGVTISPSVSPSASYVGSVVGAPLTVSQLFKKTCSLCGKAYEDDWNDNRLTITLDDICPDCKKKSET